MDRRLRRRLVFAAIHLLATSKFSKHRRSRRSKLHVDVPIALLLRRSNRTACYPSGMKSTLLLLGFGQVGKAVARAALGAEKIYATTRNPNRLFELIENKVDPIIMPMPSAEVIEPLTIGSDILVSLPPDGTTDAILAAGCHHARSIVYVSTTSVYGSHTSVDEKTDVDANSPSSEERLRAEEIWRSIGATVIRPPGIYGPANGLHVRLRAGTYKMPGKGTNVLSRIHVDDLAQLILAVFQKNIHGETFVVGDTEPTPLCDVVGWLCKQLNLPLPESAPPDAIPSTLRANRSVDSSFALQKLGVTLKYPDFKAGFGSLLSTESK